MSVLLITFIVLSVGLATLVVLVLLCIAAARADRHLESAMDEEIQRRKQMRLRDLPVGEQDDASASGVVRPEPKNVTPSSKKTMFPTA